MIINMGYSPYGFLIEIDDTVHIDVKKNCIYRFHDAQNSSGKPDDISIGVLYINNTMMSLLSYLLIHSQNKFTTKEEVLKNVWDEHNLSSSGTRLWQVFTNLKHKLLLLNFPEDFIEYEKRKGYIIRHENIMALYYQNTDEKKIKTTNASHSRRSSVFINLRQHA
ncbi:hypothetical protein GF617_15045 [Lelliottia sp. RWM.1]|nr:hypothetical protein [Lelliottia sp. RWM.1]